MILTALMAQHPAGHAVSHQPVKLLPGMGKHTHPIGAANAEAQQYFDQGLNLLYGFNRFEAFRSFEKAAQLDPSQPWPKWGMAMAKGPHVNQDMDQDVDLKAYCALLKGIPHPYAVAARARCGGGDAAYIAAMAKLAAANLDDLDAQTFYAEALMIPVRWRWFTRLGQPAPGMADAIRVLEGVMRRNPDHPGANHFYIHAVEMSSTPERAIPASQRLMAVVPGAGHLVHMPGHIWLRVGDYEMAAAVNERAAEVDRAYLGATGVTDSPYMGYYMHNLHFIAAARQMQGRASDAIAAAKTLHDAVMPMAGAMPAMVDIFGPYYWFVLERFGRWDEMLAQPKPDSKLTGATVFWHWARTLALHAKGQDTAAERKAFAAARLAVPRNRPWMGTPAGAMFDLASHVLDARLAKDAAASVPHWRLAVASQDALSYEEPPLWYAPLRESLGGALLRSGQASEAAVVFRRGLLDSPRNGRMLFGLIQALTAQGKTESAASVEREFQEAWRRADIKLSVDSL
ncbi:MAG: hypothetical protein NTV70_25245 [Acidobacteria bacterium]|nr:hypothetical protein [Acidobacteriota bacterium]